MNRLIKKFEKAQKKLEKFHAYLIETAPTGDKKLKHAGYSVEIALASLKDAENYLNGRTGVFDEIMANLEETK